ncbi:MAG: riboflavin synthase [Saprospiraceae bacterium]|nr:riboflavin synthase [Saprospiraceae bacterium]
MFSGIVEATGVIKAIEREGSNVHFTIHSSLSGESYIDQSIAHNGVCLTVVKKTTDAHIVTAIEETLNKSNLNDLKINSLVNLERSVLATSRMDGHFVQGHVDTTVVCRDVLAADGSWYYTFELPKEYNKLVVPKGSVCINGVSLTIADLNADTFSVAIIPYTYENTNFKTLQKGNKVNIEFDILGKYIVNYLDKINFN